MVLPHGEHFTRTRAGNPDDTCATCTSVASHAPDPAFELMGVDLKPSMVRRTHRTRPLAQLVLTGAALRATKWDRRRSTGYSHSRRRDIFG
jgi:hypothetical protein